WSIDCALMRRQSSNSACLRSLDRRCSRLPSNPYVSQMHRRRARPASRPTLIARIAIVAAAIAAFPGLTIGVSAADPRPETAHGSAAAASESGDGDPYLTTSATTTYDVRPETRDIQVTVVQRTTNNVPDVDGRRVPIDREFIAIELEAKDVRVDVDGQK